MADLMAGGPATSNGNGASLPRPTAPPAQTGSPQGIRGPRMIMRERQEREARRAEREQLERVRAEEEARLSEEQNRRATERRASAAGAAGSSDYPQDPMTQRRQQRQQQSQAAAAAGSARTQQPAGQTTPLRPTRVPTSSQVPQGFSNVPPTDNITGPPQMGEPSTTAAPQRQPRTSFPHAFERWEALSAHWEGMTSFWIRKLQENTDEISQSPISAQLTRQVGDLSAAGANLFHAVVELQRLRASSERKFQRWFFDTRAEMERSQEINAMLEAALAEEREGRAAAIRNAVANTDANSKVQKQLAEMRKELAISKEEARRAWEELGRREQEERDRTNSLQQGLPTIVGGVQVVPMTQGVPSRQTSARDPRSHSQAESPEYVTAQSQGYEYSQAQAASAPPTTSAGPSTPHRQGPQEARYGPSSDGGYSDGEYMIDAHGNFIRDTAGHRIPFRSPEPPKGAGESDEKAEEYETPASHGAAPATTSYPPSSSQWATAGGSSQQQQQQQQQQSGGDYSGQGYAAPGWETMPRHHHPTRLSDVIEEDERSRTSTSYVSRP